MSLFQCTLCLSPTTNKTQTPSICDECYSDIQQLKNEPACPLCATPGTNEICATCIKSPPAFDAIIAPYVYEPPLDHLIKKFKYADQWSLAQTLAQLMPPLPSSSSADFSDLYLAAPLHPKRLKERGYNQASLLLQLWQKKNTANIQHGVLQREQNTPPQAQMPSTKSRFRNVKNSFRVTTSVEGKNIVVVDDVMTSGATLREIARTLKAANARHVTVACVARAR